MVSRALQKLVGSLRHKKGRREENLFLVEGAKSLLELLDTDWKILDIIATEDFMGANKVSLVKSGARIHTCQQVELEQMGTFSSNNAVMAIVEAKPNVPFEVSDQEYILLLDEINDPGNLGTILRIADWYGITKVVASSHTAELYNPKVISASMGSFARLNVFYTDLHDFLKSNKTYVYAARLEGNSIYKTTFNPTSGMILMGSEAHGIRETLYPMVDEFVFIPRIGRAESLNVGVATAIFCDNMVRSRGNL